MHLLQTSDVVFQALTSVGTDAGAVEVEVDGACLTGIALTGAATTDKTFFTGLVGGTTSFADSVAGAGVFTDLVSAGAVGVAGTSRLLRHTLVVFTNLAAVTIAVGVTVVLANPLTGESRRVTTLTGVFTLDVIAGLFDAFVAITLLLGTTVLGAATFETLTVDTEEVFLCAVAFFVGCTVFVTVALRPGLGATSKSCTEHDKHHNQPKTVEKTKVIACRHEWFSSTMCSARYVQKYLRRADEFDTGIARSFMLQSPVFTCFLSPLIL